MREIAEQSLGWLVLAGIVLAIVLAKRRYENKFAAAVASARAEGHAEASATAAQHVQVAVDASHNSGAAGHQCADPWACVLCAPVLYRVLAGRDRPGDFELPSAGRATRIDDNYNGAHYYVHDRAVVDERPGRVDRAVVCDDGRRGESDREPDGRGADRGDLEGVPCASLNPTGTEPLGDRPERAVLADKLLLRAQVEPRVGGGRGPGH